MGRSLARAAEAGAGRQRRAHVPAPSPDELVRLLDDQPGPLVPRQSAAASGILPDDDPRKASCAWSFWAASCSMRCASISHGAFNLCPSESCNPVSGESHCAVPETKPRPTRSNSIPIPASRPRPWRPARRLMAAGGLDVGGIEYLEAAGRAPGLLRHQRQLQSSRPHRSSLRLRSLRTRSGLPCRSDPLCRATLD